MLRGRATLQKPHLTGLDVGSIGLLLTHALAVALVHGLGPIVSDWVGSMRSGAKSDVVDVDYQLGSIV